MTRILRTTIALLAGLLALTSCSFDVYRLPLPGGADTGDDPITVKVQFADVLDLVPQSTVKVSDVTVGKVTEVDLDGYTAEVTLEIAGDTGLPANAVASIRQTSLLGEKFVSLAPPASGASSEPLADDAEIPLERSGRNPEIEEVLSALSLILNGGGVAQLKTISHELNLALEGNEGAAKSVLTQLATLVGRLEDNKADIVHAIEAVNRLAIGVEKQLPAIDSALEELPSALASLDRQRDDLVTMLTALEKLSNVGVRVIKATKESTIGTLRDLQPVLAALAEAGDALPQSLQVFLTYPFPDSLISRNPQAARDLQIGDFANLSVQMDIDVANLLNNPAGLPVTECIKLNQIPTSGTIDLAKLCAGTLSAVQACYTQKTAAACNLPGALVNTLCDSAPLPILCGGASTSSDPLGQLLGQLGLGRAAPGEHGTTSVTYGELMENYDPDLVSLLIPGVAR